VVGLGVIGASAVWQLAGRGVRVLGIDAHARGHLLGSSHGRSRIIREAYYEAVEYVPLVQRAFGQWRELEAESGLDLLAMTGCLNIGTPGTHVVDGVIASARTHGLECEVLDAGAMRRRFPAFHLPDDQIGVYQPNAGILNADACVGALLDGAVSRGATIRHGIAATSWRADGDGVAVDTQEGTIRAGKLVVAAGPWSSAVLARLGLPLQAVRQYVTHFEPNDPSRFTAPTCPAFIWDVPEGEVYVAIESPRGEIGCYIASDGTSTPYRMHGRAPSFVNIQCLPHMMADGLIADTVAVISSVDPIMGEVDR